MTPKERKEHFNRVAALPCIVPSCGRSGHTTLHHPHGGSMCDEGHNRGGAQKPSDWLVLPVCAFHHQGKYGFDSAFGVRSAEDMWGKQTDMVRALSKMLNLDLFELASNDAPERSSLTSSKMLPRIPL